MKQTTTTTIENFVRHFANKLGIKIQKVTTDFTPSYKYQVEEDEYDETNNDFRVALTVDENTPVSVLRKFIGLTEFRFATRKRTVERNEGLFIYIDNIDID